MKILFHFRLVSKLAVLLAVVVGTGYPMTGWGCATCMGNPESPLTQGLNWGIASLLGVVMAVLGGAVTFFVALARRAARYERHLPSDGRSADVGITQATGTIQSRQS